jgi:hypothetical protein
MILISVNLDLKKKQEDILDKDVYLRIKYTQLNMQ